MRPEKCALKAFGLIFLMLSAFVLQSCGSAQRGAMINAYKAFEKDDCHEVMRKLSQAESYSEPAPELRAEISFLRARCLEKQSQTNEAIGVYKYIINTFPESEYAYRAKERVKTLEQ